MRKLIVNQLGWMLFGTLLGQIKPLVAQHENVVRSGFNNRRRGNV
jgi:hypothetical protein